MFEAGRLKEEKKDGGGKSMKNENKSMKFMKSEEKVRRSSPQTVHVHLSSPRRNDLERSGAGRLGISPRGKNIYKKIKLKNKPKQENVNQLKLLFETAMPAKGIKVRSYISRSNYFVEQDHYKCFVSANEKPAISHSQETDLSCSQLLDRPGKNMQIGPTRNDFTETAENAN
jgi:hypothetical protein